MKALTGKKYSLIVLSTLLAVLAVIVGVNVVVDPYGMYRLVDINGFNSHKPAIYHRVRLAKAYDIRRIKPRTVILGTSRTHLGVRPSHEAFGAGGKPVYNLAFDGATTKEMYYYLRHAHAVQPLRQVVLGLDTYHPTPAPGSNRPDFDEQMLLQPDSRWSRFKVCLADMKLLISFDTMSESLATVRAQKSRSAEWFAPDGQRLGEVFFHQPWEDFQTRGPRHYFDEIDKLEVRYKLEWRIPAKPGHNNKQGPEAKADGITSLGYIQRMIEFCRTEGIRLSIFLTPSHAHQLEISAATGEWPSLEKGKREMVRLLSEDAARHPDQQPFPLYDFSGYSAVTTEPLPAIGSTNELRNYWDSSHFKDTVGDLVLNRMFGVNNTLDDFGVLLTGENIDKVLADTRSRQETYRETHEEDIRLIRTNVEDFKRRNNIPPWD